MNNYFDSVEFTKFEVFWFAALLLYIPAFFNTPNFFNIIYAAALSVVLFCITAILSRRGYTSYTPWLEHLANQKLKNDKEIFKLIKDDKNIWKLRDFYRTDENNPMDDDDKDDAEKLKDYFFGRKPEDEEDKWYEVFTETFDYTIYDVLFQVIYPKWIAQNYEGETNELQEDKKVKPEYAFKDLINNPELFPTKKDLDDYREPINSMTNANSCNIDYETEMNKQFENLENKDDDEKKLLKDLIDIFPTYWKDEETKKKIQKLLIKKAKIDIEYFAVMVNFRKALEDVSADWLKIIDEQEKFEKKDFQKKLLKRNVGGTNLMKDVEYQIIKLRNNFSKLYDTYVEPKKEEESEIRKILSEELKKQEEDSLEKKMEHIDEILSNRNEWESYHWRSMGVIYYRWRESIMQIRESGKYDDAVNASRELPSEDPDKRKIDYEPLDEAKQNITVRAVNDLTEWFGSDDSGKAGKVILFFGVVFGIIAAVALTNSIDSLIAFMFDEDTGQFIPKSFVDNFYMVLLFLGFFPLAILYYHGGTVFLSAEASGRITSGKNVLVLVNFFIILALAIALYFLAGSIADAETFLWIVITLSCIDITWILIFTANDMKDSVRDAPIFIEWIFFDIVVILFALVFIFNFGYNTPDAIPGTWEYTDEWLIFSLLFGILVLRLGVDYRYAWKNFWSQFGDAE